MKCLNTDGLSFISTQTFHEIIPQKESCNSLYYKKNPTKRTDTNVWVTFTSQTSLRRHIIFLIESQ